MSGLTDFLLARIAEDEAVAQTMLRRLYQDHNEGLFEFEDCHNSPILCIDPRRAVSECRAKRALLADHAVYEGDGLGRCGACADVYVAVPWDGLCDVAQILASVYSDHLDYQPEWAD